RARVAQSEPYRTGVGDGRQVGPLRRAGRRRCHQLDGVELLIWLPQELREEADAARVAHANLETVECDGPVLAVAAAARATRPGPVLADVDGLRHDVDAMSGVTAEREHGPAVVIDGGAARGGVGESGQRRRGALVQPQPLGRSGCAVDDVGDDATRETVPSV